MRIIAGHLRGREVKSPKGFRTHPMSDKVRGALFNVLGDVEGLTFLDAFAGSGALSFEAISRGAKSAVAIDKDSSAHKVLEQNTKELCPKTVKAVKANTAGWSIHNMEKRFDILLLDPPYDELQPNLLQKLANRHVNPGGLAVLSFPGRLEEAPGFASFKIAVQKDYGDAQLIFYRKNQ